MPTTGNGGGTGGVAEEPSVLGASDVVARGRGALVGWFGVDFFPTVLLVVTGRPPKNTKRQPPVDGAARPPP